MTTTRPPICLVCSHLQPIDLSKPEARYTCAAFPGGVPLPILTNEADHREPYEGDNGIRFAPIGES